MADDERHSYFSALALSYVGLLALSLVPLHFALIAIHDGFFETAKVNKYLITGFVAVQLSAGLLRAFLQAFAPSGFLLANDIVRTVLILSALAGTVVASITSHAFDPYAGVIALQTGALGAYLFLFVLYCLVRRLWATLDFSALAVHRRRSGLTTLVAIVRFFQVNTPLLLAQFLLGEQVFGVLRTCQTIANFAGLPLNAFRLNNFAKSAIAFTSGGTQHLVSHVMHYVLKLALMALVCGLFVLAVLLVIPEGLRPGSEPLAYILLFLACTVISTVNPALDAYFYARGDLTPVLKRSLLGVAVAVLCAPASIHYFGALGAPIALFAVLLFVCIATAFLIYRETRYAQAP
ncbi:MAG: hypothetical protein AAF559_04245 [Pseudomonadota bacterium]